MKLPPINLLSLKLYFHNIERNSWYCTKFWNILFSKVYASSAIYFNIHISLSKRIETNYVLSQMQRYHWYHMNPYIIQKADFLNLLIWLLGKLYLHYKKLWSIQRTNSSYNNQGNILSNIFTNILLQCLEGCLFQKFLTKNDNLF